MMRIDSSVGLRDGVRRLRRGLRDVRDRMARHKKRWRDVCCTGMAGGDGRVVVMILHEDIERCAVEDVLRRRWPNAVVKELEQEESTVAMSPGDAADLGRHRRGVEPLRIVVMPSTIGRSSRRRSRGCRFLCEALSSRRRCATAPRPPCPG